MRIALDTEETNSEPRRSTTPKEELEWVPLEKHPVFIATNNNSVDGDSGTALSRNLAAWDGSSRLYFWEPKTKRLHRLSLRLGEPEPTSILAATPSKVFLTLVAVATVAFVFLFCSVLTKVFELRTYDFKLGVEMRELLQLNLSGNRV